MQDSYARHLSRVNVIGAVVSLDEQQVVIDDGSAKIVLRTFDDSASFGDVDIGSVVLVIGKVREYNDEKYIIPEIIRQIDDPAWVKVRQKELEIIEKQPKVMLKQQEETVVEEDIVKSDIDYHKKPGLDSSPEEIQDTGQQEDTPADKIYRIIRDIDTGKGAAIEEIIQASGDLDAEKIINNFLIEGDVFEISPGRVKILE